ncbi:MAG: hypothetical protein AAF415_20550 [Pseudomonadota bacterium]
MRLKPALCLASALALAASPALPQENETERATRLLLRIMNHYSLLFLRSAVDLTYESLSISPKTYNTVITGLEIYPVLDWDQDGACVISIDRISSGTIYSFETSKSLMEVNGIHVPRACLEPEQSAMLVGFGYDDGLRSDAMSIQISYDLPSSAAEIGISTTVNEALDISLDAAFDYLWIRLPLDTPAADPEPVALLGALEATIENRGLWEKVEPMLGAQIGDLGIAPEMVQGMILQGLSSPDQPAPNAETEAFAANVGAEIGRFLTEKNRLVITAEPEGSVWLDPDAFDDPQQVIALLQPQVSAVPAAIRRLIAPQALSAALTDPAGLEAAERLRIGEALLSGVGAPRSVSEGTAILTPLTDAWDGAASLLVADALADQDNGEGAYTMVLRAMAAGESGAISLADDLEAGMTLGEVLILQDQALTAWPGAASRVEADQTILESGDVGALRQRAYDAALGKGTPRDYRSAYFWATLASAAGDPGAATLRQRLDNRFARGGGADAQAWTALTDEVGSLAFQTWTDQGLAARIITRFGAQP